MPFDPNCEEFKQFSEFLTEIKLFYRDAAGKVALFDLTSWTLILKGQNKAYERSEHQIISLNSVNAIYTLSVKGLSIFFKEKGKIKVDIDQ